MSKLTDYLKSLFFIIILIQITPPILKNIIKQYSHILEPKTKVAYVPIKGILYDSRPITKYLRKYFKNNEIKAILLIIDCPGGAAGSAEAIANEIHLLKKEYPKPILSIAENICTSGAYYIAASTHYIISSPSTLIGSIGVSLPYQFKFDELLKKYNITYIPIKSGKYKGATDPFIPITPDKQTMLQTLTERSYQNFIKHIAQNRPKLSLDNSKKWADGKIFSGNEAFELGLIDKVGSQSNAINKIRELAVIEGKIEWIRPKQQSSLWNIFFGRQNTDELKITVPTLQQVFIHCLQYITKTQNHDTICL